MTLKNISGAISNRIQVIKNKKETEDILSERFKSFIVDVYGKQTTTQLSFSLEYTRSNKRLVIMTKSKIFANDLILRLDKLTEYLTGRTREVREIVIK